MPKLVKNGNVIENTISVLDKESMIDSVSDNTLVPLALFLENTETCLGFNNTGVWIDSDEGPEALEPHLDKLSIIGVNFPKFADGRPMSPFDDEASLPPTETTTRISPAVIGALVLAILAALGVILWFVCFTL